MARCGSSFPLGHKRNGLMTFREILASRQAEVVYFGLVCW